MWLPRVVSTPNAPQLYYLFLLTFNILLGLLYFIDRVKISDLKFEVIMDTNCATKLTWLAFFKFLKSSSCDKILWCPRFSNWIQRCSFISIFHSITMFYDCVIHFLWAFYCFLNVVIIITGTLVPLWLLLIFFCNFYVFWKVFVSSSL